MAYDGARIFRNAVDVHLPGIDGVIDEHSHVGE